MQSLKKDIRICKRVKEIKHLDEKCKILKQTYFKLFGHSCMSVFADIF